MYNIEIELNEKELALVLKKPELVRKGLLRGVRNSMLMAERYSKETFNTPGHLKVRSGRLRSSITASTKEQGKYVVGLIGTDVVYGKIHEYGGIHPRSKTIRMPARPYIGPSFTDDKLNKYAEQIKKSIMEEVKQ